MRPTTAGTAAERAAHRPPRAALDAARASLEALILEAADRGWNRSEGYRAYWLLAAATAEHLGVDPGTYVRRAREEGATWQAVADALGTTRGNAHGRFRGVDAAVTR